MTPRLDHWLFSFKALLAGLLALAVAFWIDLPRPYWALATVYIASQPLAGATLSKAFFRVIGTLAGAAMAVALVPNLVNAPPVLVLAMALWGGLCLYLSILDRTPRGYAFMLAGYTTAIIGFPAVDAPGQIFDLALSRTEEIVVGILSASLIASLIFPRSVGPVAAEAMALWSADARAAARDALAQAGAELRRAHWMRLAGDTAKIENLAVHLPFEAAAERNVLPAVGRLVPRMLMTLPNISAIGDLIVEIHALGGPSPAMASLIASVDAALRQDDADALARPAEAIDAFISAHGETASWRDLVELHLALRLRDLVALMSDHAALAHALENGDFSRATTLRFSIEGHPPRMRHDERERALVAAVTVSIALVLCCSLWILTSWPDGAAAAMMTAVAGSLFATQDDPAPSIRLFAAWSAAAVGVSGIYVFGVLPNVHSFETLALALAPAMLLFGLLIAEPRTFVIGIALGIITPTAMALQRAYDVDAEAFLNSGFAIVAGMSIAAVVTAILRRADARLRIARFIEANERSLAALADIESRRSDAQAMGLMFDRLALLAPLAQAADDEVPDAMMQLRAGLNIVEARKARARLSMSERRRIDAALLRLRQSYRRHLPPGAKTLQSLNRAIYALGRSDRSDSPALLALAGLRRCLFPKAPPPHLSGEKS